MVNEDDINNIAEFYEIVNNDIRMAFVSYHKLDTKIKSRLSFKNYLEVIHRKDDMIRNYDDEE